MGLDWRPFPKAKPGFEDEYLRIMDDLVEEEPAKFSWREFLFGSKKEPKYVDRDKLLEELKAVSISAYETLGAPRVGYDESANAWAREEYETQDLKISFEEYLEEIKGYNVVDLVSDNDGVQVYHNYGTDPQIFRADWLKECHPVISKAIINEAYEIHTAQESIDFGQRLMAIADEYAQKHNVLHMKNVEEGPDIETSSPELIAHIIYCAAKWLIWWGENGHGYEADY